MSAFRVKATSGGEGDFEAAPAGTFPAVLVALIDLGTHDEEYAGKPRLPPPRKILLVWEVDCGDEGRHVVGRDYTLSFHEKASLRQLYEAWTGKTLNEDDDVDLTERLGKTALVQLVHKQSAKGRTYARLDAVVKAPKGTQPVKPTHAPLAWSVDGSEPAPAAEWLPWLRGRPLAEVIAASHERRGKKPQPAGNGQPAAVPAAADEAPDDYDPEMF